jgi:3-oxoacyl-[acyl-carrier-protein] synthase III
VVGRTRADTFPRQSALAVCVSQNRAGPRSEIESRQTTIAMSATQVHIAGVGISTSPPQDLNNSAIDAGTKALLDAGITYGKVQLSVACSLGDTQTRIPQACFKAFGRQKAPTGSMDSASALYMAAQCVRNGQIDCAMLIGLDTVSKHDRKGGTCETRLTVHVGTY